MNKCIMENIDYRMMKKGIPVMSISDQMILGRGY